jgi:hypothetical protein
MAQAFLWRAQIKADKAVAIGSLVNAQYEMCSNQGTRWNSRLWIGKRAERQT